MIYSISTHRPPRMPPDALSRAIEGDSFDEWEREPFQSFLLDEI